MYKIVMIRHGESVWNRENRFTGWEDVDLSDKGREEAKQAGEILKKEGYRFDIAFTSYLKRAILTLNSVLDTMDMLWIPVEKSWRLNERHYGALQGLNKAETAQKHSEEQVKIWRRSYDVSPPVLSTDDARYPGNDIRYSSLSKQELPLSECLKDTVDRFIPYWNNTIAPAIQLGKKVIIAAHGNSLRAAVKYLDTLSDEEILSVNIPTGVPLVYELDNQLQSVNHYYLGDEEAIQSAMESVANQGKAK